MPPANIGLLTGGSDKPYALGLASALAGRGVAIDFIGSDELDCAAVHAIPDLRFLNLRGDQREDVAFHKKVSRILTYYSRLLRYAARGGTPILHILWNNKFEFFDRTFLMAYYRLVGKRVVLTAHNVNVAARDGRDRWLNRQSLRIQYRLCDHVFVHTDAMKHELISTFGVRADKVTVIPFGMNDTLPQTVMTPGGARQQLGLERQERTLLFFGQIAPYKGLEFLVEAIALLASNGERVRLMVAGKVKRGHENYWQRIQRDIERLGIEDLVVRRIQFIPDNEVEPYFKAADAVVLPYVNIFQSGVPFLAFSFGLPVIATDVGSLREDVTEETGLLCRTADAADLAKAIRRFFGSSLLYRDAAASLRIRAIATERHAWSTVALRTIGVYASLTPPKSTSTRGAAPTDVPYTKRSTCQE